MSLLGAPSRRKLVWFCRAPFAEMVMEPGKVFELPSSALAGASTVPAVTSVSDAALRPFKGSSTMRCSSTTSLNVVVVVLICAASVATSTDSVIWAIDTVTLLVEDWSVCSTIPVRV
jgi:hypothetical protein